MSARACQHELWRHGVLNSPLHTFQLVVDRYECRHCDYRTWQLGKHGPSARSMFSLHLPPDETR